MTKLTDGTGSGYEAKVDSNNRLETAALTTSIQHEVSHNDEQAYQAFTEQSIGISDVPILVMTNDSDTQDIVVTYLRVHTAGAAITNENAYFSVKLGGSYTSGGTAVVPTNMNVGSANIADVSMYDSTGTPLVLGGIPSTVDKMHETETEVAYNKEGSLILRKGQSLSIFHKGSTVAGIAYSRVSFYFADKVS